MFLGILSCTVFFSVGNVKACNREVLKSEIFDMCKRYDVGFCYKNPNSGEKLYYNSSKKYDPASVRKVCLALCVFKMVEENKIYINEMVEYKECHKCDGTGIIKFGVIGDKYSIDQLLELLIIRSDNVAYRMLGERIGENNLKDFLAQIGTPVKTGRCIDQEYSAEDLIKHIEFLFRFVSKGTYLSERAASYFSTGIYNDQIPSGVSSRLHVLHKPGWIPCELISHDVAIIYDESRDPYFLIIMSKGIPETMQSEFFRELTSKTHMYHLLCKKSK